MTSAVSTSRVRSIIVSSALSFALVACGGGGDEPIAPPAPTALPSSLTITAPSTRQSVSSDVKLSSNTSDPERTLTYSWNFGDGTIGSDANVTHRYSRSGSYEVKLTVTNEAGAVISTTTTVKVAELSLVQGKFCTGADSAGWCWQNPLPQGNLIGEQAWFDEKRGWAVGESGTILKTVDGGATWQPQASGVDAPLRTVLIVSPTVVWVGGDNGLLVITEDGGSSWRTASTGRSNSLRGLQALDGRAAWLAVAGGSFTTLDGGLSWTTAAVSDNSFYSAISQTSPTQFWMTGTDASGVVVNHPGFRGGHLI
jgi:PKD repeat protein